MDADRDELNRFVKKGNEPRLNRCIRLTDTCWRVLDEVARDRDCTRSDLLEELAENKFEDVIDGDGSTKDEVIDILEDIIESLEPGNDPLIDVDHRQKATGRRVLRLVIDYLETSI